MLRVGCQIVRWVDDQFVEVRLTDADGTDWMLVDKAAVVGDEFFKPGDPLPYAIYLACEVVREDGDCVVVSTERPWGVTTADGQGEFRVRRRQLLGGLVAWEAGFYSSADELRAVRSDVPHDWERDALRYLEQGELVVIPGSYVPDLLDPGRRVKERGEWTDGVWVWNGTLVHYLRKYHVALPEEFLAHMAANAWTVPPVSDDEMHELCRLRFPFWEDDVEAPAADA